MKIQRFVFALICLIANLSGKVQSSFEEFLKFIKYHNKEYSSIKELELRYSIFSEALKEIGAETDVYSPFMDLTDNEFAHRYGLKLINNSKNQSESLKVEYELNAAPTSFDYTTTGAVTPVKDQKDCGSCWAFSTTGNIEGQYFLKYKKGVSFSEQQLVDCDHEYNDGCEGGLPISAFEYLQFAGIMSEDSYPYEGVDGDCRYKKKDVVLYVDSFASIDSNEDQIKEILYAKGPLSVALNALPIKNYVPGTIFIPTSSNCNPFALNHAVLLVGYGVSPLGIPYWKVKNSWGASWGENGYFRIIRGQGACGINRLVSTAILN